MSRCLGAKGLRDCLWRFSNPRLGVMVLFAGAYRGPSRRVFMRTKRVEAVDPDEAATPTAVQRLLRGLSIEELEPIAIEVVREHRRRLQYAQDLFEVLERNDENRAASEEVVRPRQDYRMALLNLHGQHQLVSLVVAALGYVPEVDSQSPDDSSPH